MTLRRMLEQRAAQGLRLTPRDVEPLLTQLVEALDSAHQYGPHSNLKPENIVILPGRLKVTDYGLALGIPRLPFLQAQKVWRMGCYVAPEYAKGGELDTRMDVYPLGVILGELLTGQKPEEVKVPELLAHDPELPPGLEALYRRATHANPLVRPKTAGEFLAEFTEALSCPRPAFVAIMRTPEPAPASRPSQVPVARGAPAPVARAEPRPEVHASSGKTAPRSTPAPLSLRPRFRASMGTLMLLMLAGLGLGAAGGYWLLRKTRHGSQAPAAPSDRQGVKR
jgi:serine/threonine-protein kinase